MSGSALGWLKPILRNEPVATAHSPVWNAHSPVLTKPGILTPLGPSQTHNGKKNKKNIYDYHWLVWKTGLTPTPAPKTPAPPTPAPPTPGAQYGYRGYTPIPEDDTPLPAHLCETDRTASAGGWVRPEPPAFRSPTPAFHRCATPASMKPVVRNNMTTPIPANAYLKEHQEYKPALQAWISQADDYERDVAYNLFKALDQGNGYMPPGGRKKTRPHTATGGVTFKPPQQKRYQRPVTAGIRTSVPQYGAQYNPQDDPQYLNIVAKSLGSQNPTQFKYTTGRKPARLAHGNKHTAQQADDHINVGSFFQNSKLPYKTHYSIHPEFASEPRNIPWKR